MLRTYEFFLTAAVLKRNYKAIITSATPVEIAEKRNSLTFKQNITAVLLMLENQVDVQGFQGCASIGVKTPQRVQYLVANRQPVNSQRLSLTQKEALQKFFMKYTSIRTRRRTKAKLCACQKRYRKCLFIKGPPILQQLFMKPFSCRCWGNNLHDACILDVDVKRCALESKLYLQWSLLEYLLTT